MEKKILIQGKSYKCNLFTPLVRYRNNPVLTSHQVNKAWQDPHHQVITVHNAGVSFTGKEYIMLFRSHLRNGISILGIARSQDGITDWKVDKQPAIMPAASDDSFGKGTNVQQLIKNEQGGVEDPRICKIDDTYYITYSAYHGEESNKTIVRVSLITTNDFTSFKRWGPLLEVDMRNVVIFPEKIDNQYAALFRPNEVNATQVGHIGGIFKQIRIGYADSIVANQWKLKKKPIMQQGSQPSTFADKIGPGATPLKTPHGWINIFHGVRGTMDGNPYCLGVALHDLNNIENITVCNLPILMPSAADCRVKEDDYVHVPNVVFTCGAVRLDDGTIYVYYGGNDTVMNVAVTHEDVLAELCVKYPQEPLTGNPLFTQ